MSNDSLDDMIKAMLAVSQKNKAQTEQKEQEEKAREEEKLKLLQAIKYQREHLINLLNAVVEKFNQQSTPTEKIVITQQEITEDSIVYQTVLYTLPNNPRPIILVFFNLDPMLNLSHDNHGFVPFGAYLRGYNSKFLWCRANNNDRLGKWIGCRIATSPLHPGDISSYEAGQRFNEQTLRALELTETNASPSTRYEGDVRKEFAQVMLEAMQGS